MALGIRVRAWPTWITITSTAYAHESGSRGGEAYVNYESEDWQQSEQWRPNRQDPFVSTATGTAGIAWATVSSSVAHSSTSTPSWVSWTSSPPGPEAPCDCNSVYRFATSMATLSDSPFSTSTQPAIVSDTLFQTPMQMENTTSTDVVTSTTVVTELTTSVRTSVSVQTSVTFATATSSDTTNQGGLWFSTVPTPSPTSTQTQGSTQHSPGLSGGEVAFIAILASIVFAVLVFAAFFVWNSRRRARLAVRSYGAGDVVDVDPSEPRSPIAPSEMSEMSDMGAPVTIADQGSVIAIGAVGSGSRNSASPAPSRAASGGNWSMRSITGVSRAVTPLVLPRRPRTPAHEEDAGSIHTSDYIDGRFDGRDTPDTELSVGSRPLPPAYGTLPPRNSSRIPSTWAPPYEVTSPQSPLAVSSLLTAALSPSESPFSDAAAVRMLPPFPLPRPKASL
ncbi:uncharacterized protein BXZ73DRAFT_104746 [Epithele typhae]|uniref:uncharacterized protein n=1 Tax=Epithele typhae TaxID=378194 RepID=UPI00200817CC|nr:uncharacterized protein BXZ73DRAFT_104746 [Epithele typhae]KAH9920231.1 hypothetical protein BXZ73DRAFT_104746 [Epithele typhae]